MTPSISDRRRILEVVAVGATAAGKFIFMDWLAWRLPFILCTILGWLCYIWVRKKSTPRILAYYGFRTDNFSIVLRMLLPFGLIGVAACFVTGYILGALNLTWHIVPILLIYPIWGALQQFLCVGIVAGNLQDMGYPIRDNLIIVITAVLFSVIHYPDRWLMIGTFVLALIYSAVFLRQRNVYALGLFHGWLGAIFYYTVVGRDPFAEVFGMLSK